MNALDLIDCALPWCSWSVQADLSRARIDVLAMVEALRASERERAAMDEDAPVDAGCADCTLGTVPNDRNTGRCAHHLRVRVLAKFPTPDKDPTR